MYVHTERKPTHEYEKLSGSRMELSTTAAILQARDIFGRRCRSHNGQRSRNGFPGFSPSLFFLGGLVLCELYTAPFCSNFNFTKPVTRWRDYLLDKKKATTCVATRLFCHPAVIYLQPLSHFCFLLFLFLIVRFSPQKSQIFPRFSEKESTDVNSPIYLKPIYSLNWITFFFFARQP